MVDKSALAQWASDLAIAWATVNWSLLGTRSDEDGWKAGRFRWKDVRDERAHIGTMVHEIIEADLNGEWVVPEPDSLEVAQAVAQWEQFKAEHVIEPLLVEVTLWSHTFGYAGTCDIIIVIDGETWLIDNKTSKGLWPEHEYQLAALASSDVAMVQQDDETWVEVEMPKIERYGFLHLRPDYHDPLKNIHIPAFYELVEVPAEDIPYLFESFKAYLAAWNAKKATEGLRKSRESAKVETESEESK